MIISIYMNVNLVISLSSYTSPGFQALTQNRCYYYTYQSPKNLYVNEKKDKLPVFLWVWCGSFQQTWRGYAGAQE